MQVRSMRRFVYRQLILPQEYQEKLLSVKRIIQEYTHHKPSSEETLMCMIDEFLNLHGKADHNDGIEASVVETAGFQSDPRSQSEER